MREFRIIQADVIDGLRTLPDDSVHCCVTSPPYFGLRDYGVTGQLGLEVSYPDYIARLVDVFREVRRALRPDGTLWLNLGDSYATGAGKVGECPGGGEQGERFKGYRGTHTTEHSGKAAYRMGEGGHTQANRLPQPGLKPKDLMMIPARVAIALQNDGWYLRSDIIWAKSNPMPESVTDRPTKAHEYLFLLTKSERYAYDAAAIAEPCGGFNGSTFTAGKTADARKHLAAIGQGKRTEPTDRNKRTVWSIATQPYTEAHFAVMPTALVEPCVMAGCPEGGTVIDPFAGSGTVGVVALRHARNFIGIELNPAYVEMARNRIMDDAPMFNAEVCA